MLLAAKAAPMAQGVVDEVVPDAGIIFDPKVISQTIESPPPGWNGDEREAMDAVWWKDYLDQLLKIVPIQGPDSIP